MASAVQVHQDITKCGQRITRHLDAWRKFSDIWKSDRAALLDKFKVRARGGQRACPLTARLPADAGIFKQRCCANLARACAARAQARAPGCAAYEEKFSKFKQARR